MLNKYDNLKMNVCQTRRTACLPQEAYDTRKQLWRVSLHPLLQFYDAKVPWYRANIWHDLSNGSYLLAGVDTEIKTP